LKGGVVEEEIRYDARRREEQEREEGEEGYCMK